MRTQFDQVKIVRAIDKLRRVENKVSQVEAIAKGLCRDCQYDSCVSPAGRCDDCQEHRDSFYYEKLTLGDL